MTNSPSTTPEEALTASSLLPRNPDQSLNHAKTILHDAFTEILESISEDPLNIPTAVTAFEKKVREVNTLFERIEEVCQKIYCDNRMSYYDLLLQGVPALSKDTIELDAEFTRIFQDKGVRITHLIKQRIIEPLVQTSISVHELAAIVEDCESVPHLNDVQVE